MTQNSGPSRKLLPLASCVTRTESAPLTAASLGCLPCRRDRPQRSRRCLENIPVLNEGASALPPTEAPTTEQVHLVKDTRPSGPCPFLSARKTGPLPAILANTSWHLKSSLLGRLGGSFG